MAEKEDCAGNESALSSLRKQGPIRRGGFCLDAVVDGYSLNNEGWWLWVPAFAGTTLGVEPD